MQYHTQMETHVKVVGWLYIVMGGLGILAAALVFLTVFGGGLISGDRTAIGVTFIVATAVAVVLLILSVPGVIAGFGLLSFKPWARILALVLGILNLPGFPLGTLLGIYTLYALVDEEGARLFKPVQ